MFSIDIDASALESGKVSKINVYLEYPMVPHISSERMSVHETIDSSCRTYTRFEIEHDSVVDAHTLSPRYHPYNALRVMYTHLEATDLSSNFLSNLYPIRPLMICHATKSFPSRDGMYFPESMSTATFFSF